MKGKIIVWVGSFATIFLFLPSLAIKIWIFFTKAPWAAKSWMVYILLGIITFLAVRRRFHKKLKLRPKEEISLLFIAKERLVKGEITLEEFREIRKELD